MILRIQLILIKGFYYTNYIINVLFYQATLLYNKEENMKKIILVHLKYEILFWCYQYSIVISYFLYCFLQSYISQSSLLYYCWQIFYALFIVITLLTLLLILLLERYFYWELYKKDSMHKTKNEAKRQLLRQQTNKMCYEISISYMYLSIYLSMYSTYSL